MKKRLLEIANYYGLSIRSFEQKCGLTRGNISNMSEEGTIGSDKLSKIYDNFPDLNLEWLLTGKGSMLRDTSEEIGKSPDTVAKESIPVYYTREDGRKVSLTATDTADGIPLIPIEAIAGFGSGEQVAMEYECERYVVPMFRGADFLISVKGSSMIPKYNSGDIVACKRLAMQSIFFQWNKVYVLDTEQGALIKRVKQGSDAEHILIVSENPNYEPFELHLSQVYSVALVMGVIRLE